MKGTNWKQSGQVYVVVRVIKLLNWACGMNNGYTNRHDNYLNIRGTRKRCKMCKYRVVRFSR